MADEQARIELTAKLVDGLYVEAMVLADEARAYFDRAASDDRLALDPVDRVGFSCESLKVTTRLMHLIARGDASRSVTSLLRRAVEEFYWAYRGTDQPAWERVPHSTIAWPTSPSCQPTPARSVSASPSG